MSLDKKTSANAPRGNPQDGKKQITYVNRFKVTKQKSPVWKTILIFRKISLCYFLDTFNLKYNIAFL